MATFDIDILCLKYLKTQLGIRIIESIETTGFARRLNNFEFPEDQVYEMSLKSQQYYHLLNWFTLKSQYRYIDLYF